MKSLKELDLLDRFLFSVAMEDKVIHKNVLEILQGEKIIHTTARTEEIFQSEKLREIQKRVNQLKLSEEMGVRYMQAWEEKAYEREEGREEGRIEGRKNLIGILKECHIPDEIIIQKLIERYGLTKEEAQKELLCIE